MLMDILKGFAYLLPLIAIAWGLESRIRAAMQNAFQHAVAVVLFAKTVRTDIDEAILSIVKSWAPTHSHITQRDAETVKRLWELSRNARAIEEELRWKLKDPNEITNAERCAIESLFSPPKPAVSVNTKPSCETLKEWFEAMLAIKDEHPPTNFQLRHSGAFDVHNVHDHALEPNEANAEFLSTKFQLLAEDHVRHTRGAQTFHVVATSKNGGLWGSKFFTMQGGGDAVGEVQRVYSA